MTDMPASRDEVVMLPCLNALAWLGNVWSPEIRAEACATAVAEFCLDRARVPAEATLQECIARLPSTVYAGFSHRMAQLAELFRYFLTQLVARDIVPARVTTTLEFTDYAMRFVCPDLSRYGVLSLEERTHDLYRRVMLSEDDDDLELDEAYVVVSAYDPRLHAQDVDEMLMVYDSAEYNIRHATLNSMVDDVVKTTTDLIHEAFRAFIFSAVRDVRPALSSLTRATASSILVAMGPYAQDACAGGALLRLLLAELRTSVNDAPAAGARLSRRVLEMLHRGALEPVRHATVLLNDEVIGDFTRVKPSRVKKMVAALLDVRVEDLGNINHFIVEVPVCIATLVTRLLSVDYTPTVAKTTLSIERIEDARQEAHCAVRTADRLKRVLVAATRPASSVGVRLQDIDGTIKEMQARVALTEAVTLLCHTLSICPAVSITAYSYRAVIHNALGMRGVFVTKEDGSFVADLMPVFEFLMHDGGIKRYKQADRRGSTTGPRIATAYARVGDASEARPPMENAVVNDRFATQRVLSHVNHTEQYERLLARGVVPELAALCMLPTFREVVGVTMPDLCVYALVFNLVARCSGVMSKSGPPTSDETESDAGGGSSSAAFEPEGAVAGPGRKSRKRPNAAVEVSVPSAMKRAVVPKATCPVCYETCNEEGMLEPGGGCGHRVCQTCVVEGVSVAVTEMFHGTSVEGSTASANSFSCFEPSCKHVFDKHVVFPLLSHVHAVMAGYTMVDIEREGRLLEAGNTACQMCEHVFLEDATTVVKTCPVCTYVECRQCKTMSHPGIACTAIIDADTAADGISADDLVTECSDVVPCPSCRTPFSKISGCNHMTCNKRVPGTTDRCGTHFCYTCGERVEIRPGLLQQHYSGGRCVHDVSGQAGGPDVVLRRTIAAIQYAREAGMSPITKKHVTAATAAAALLVVNRG